MNENIEAFLNELERHPNNILELLVSSSEYFEETDLQDIYENWKGTTELILKRLKSMAERGGMDAAAEIIGETIDNI